jgi:hypothetical protein
MLGQFCRFFNVVAVPPLTQGFFATPKNDNTFAVDLVCDRRLERVKGGRATHCDQLPTCDRNF